MKNESRKEKRLLDEIEEMRKRVAELERIEAERRKVEEAVKASEEKLSRTFESVKDGIVITDLDGNIVEINNRVLQLGGHTRSY